LFAVRWQNGCLNRPPWKKRKAKAERRLDGEGGNTYRHGLRDFLVRALSRSDVGGPTSIGDSDLRELSRGKLFGRPGIFGSRSFSAVESIESEVSRDVELGVCLDPHREIC
jgi:hypothetical protein